MERTIYLLIICSLFVVGCDNASSNNTISRTNDNSVSDIQLNSKNVDPKSNTPSNFTDKQISIVEKAQKDYQDSYNEYVKCLRESGPQTIETLQALTIYQKNYQIYQMILKAESQKQ